MNDKHFLLQAILKAKESVGQGGFPAGAIVVKDGIIVGAGASLGSKLHDPTSHGEIVAIKQACQCLKTTDLSGSILYASMEPCLMCFGASMWSNITKIIFACRKERVSSTYYGGECKLSLINSELTHPIELVHLPELEEESLAIVRAWEYHNKPY